MLSQVLSKHAEQLDGVKDLIGYELASRRTPTTDVLFEYIEEFMTRPAKYVRPLLTIAICDHLGGNLEKAQAVAAAIEIYHNATLMMDDLQDNSDFRRGGPAVHTSTSSSLAISIAALTRTLMFHPIHRCRVFSDVERNYVHQVIDDTCTNVSLGQGLEMLWAFERKVNVQEDDYLEMVQLKTGALFAACCRLAAYISCLDPVAVNEIAEIGLEFGTTFQLRNDSIDMLSSTINMTRPSYDDLREGKRTLLTIHALRMAHSRGDTARVDFITASLTKQTRTETDLQLFLDVLQDEGSMQYVEDTIRQRLDCTMQRVRSSRSMPESLKADLLGLAAYLEMDPSPTK